MEGGRHSSRWRWFESWSWPSVCVCVRIANDFQSCANFTREHNAIMRPNADFATALYMLIRILCMSVCERSHWPQVWHECCIIISSNQQYAAVRQRQNNSTTHTWWSKEWWQRIFFSHSLAFNERAVSTQYVFDFCYYLHYCAMKFVQTHITNHAIIKG